MLIIHEETCHSCKFATRTVKYIRTKYDDVICCINEECSKGGCHGAFRKDEIETLKKHPSVYLKCDLWESKIVSGCLEGYDSIVDTVLYKLREMNGN